MVLKGNSSKETAKGNIILIIIVEPRKNVFNTTTSSSVIKRKGSNENIKSEGIDKFLEKKKK